MLRQLTVLNILNTWTGGSVKASVLITYHPPGVNRSIFTFECKLGKRENYNEMPELTVWETLRWFPQKTLTLKLNPRSWTEVLLAALTTNSVSSRSVLVSLGFMLHLDSPWTGSPTSAGGLWAESPTLGRRQNLQNTHTVTWERGKKKTWEPVWGHLRKPETARWDCGPQTKQPHTIHTHTHTQKCHMRCCWLL